MATLRTAIHLLLVTAWACVCVCLDIDECRQLDIQCGDELAECVNTVGSYYCGCKRGHVMHDRQCIRAYTNSSLAHTGAVPAMKPDATAIGDPQDGRWKITLMFDGRRFWIPKFR